MVEEDGLWAIVRESAELICKYGMSEDRHLCLFAGGWEGLMRFTQQRLLSVEAEAVCLLYVTSLAKRVTSEELNRLDDDDAIQLNNSLIYDFPEVVTRAALREDRNYPDNHPSA